VHADEGAHDFDVHQDRARTAEDARQHRDALFREYEGEVFPVPSSPNL